MYRRWNKPVSTSEYRYFRELLTSIGRRSKQETGYCVTRSHSDCTRNIEPADMTFERRHNIHETIDFSEDIGKTEGIRQLVESLKRDKYIAEALGYQQQLSLKENNRAICQLQGQVNRLEARVKNAERNTLLTYEYVDNLSVTSGCAYVDCGNNCPTCAGVDCRNAYHRGKWFHLLLTSQRDGKTDYLPTGVVLCSLECVAHYIETAIMRTHRQDTDG
ncbi:uncharacterized protein [Ptychodera flava]|uniref:uncharacterized protein n=1 Tax=Ptychodera flava TaxID=63121 RepID=UPI00396A9350